MLNFIARVIVIFLIVVGGRHLYHTSADTQDNKFWIGFWSGFIACGVSIIISALI